MIKKEGLDYQIVQNEAVASDVSILTVILAPSHAFVGGPLGLEEKLRTSNIGGIILMNFREEIEKGLVEILKRKGKNEINITPEYFEPKDSDPELRFSFSCYLDSLDLKRLFPYLSKEVSKSTSWVYLNILFGTPFKKDIQGFLKFKKSLWKHGGFRLAIAKFTSEFKFRIDTSSAHLIDPKDFKDIHSINFTEMKNL